MGKRPATTVCAHCGSTFKLKATGRPPRFCKASCRVMAFEKAHPLPKATRVPFADKVAARVWQAMQDAGIVAADRTMPPRREDAA